MKTKDNMLEALRALRGNPMRSFLTALGVVIGVLSVIILVSIGEGAKSQVSSQIRSLGSNLIMINPGRMQPGAAAFSAATLTTDEIPLIEACSLIKRVAPEINSQRQVSFNSNSISTSITGTTPTYMEIRNLTLSGGSFFTQDDVTGATRVAVLGKDVVDELFPGQDPVGQRIKVGNVRFTVIGTLATKGQSGMMSNDDVVYVPMTTAQRRLTGNKRLRMIYAEAVSEKAMDQAVAQVKETLLNELGDENAFSVSNQADILSTAESMTGTLTMLLAGIAGVSLLVGGIGIMNIMLVSITERIKEIGLRKALGAREDEVLWQFLFEAATLSLLGGGVGIVLGAAGSVLCSMIFGWNTVVSLNSVLMAFGLSLAIGLFFGVYPARKAARLDPIVALRHE